MQDYITTLIVLGYFAGFAVVVYKIHTAPEDKNHD